MNYGISLTQPQKKSLQKAYQTGSGLNLKISHKNLQGQDMVNLNARQMKQVEKALQKGTGVMLKVSKTQLKQNPQKGGFLGSLFQALLPMAGPLLGSLFGGQGLKEDLQEDFEQKQFIAQKKNDVRKQIVVGTGLRIL